MRPITDLSAGNHNAVPNLWKLGAWISRWARLGVNFLWQTKWELSEWVQLMFFFFYTQQRLLFFFILHTTETSVHHHHTTLYKQAAVFQEGTVSFGSFLLYHRYPKYYLENSCNLIFNLIQCLNFKMVIFNNWDWFYLPRVGTLDLKWWGCMIKGVFGFRDFLDRKIWQVFFKGLDLSRDFFFFWGGGVGGIPNKLNTPGNFRLYNCIVSALF